MTLPPPDPAFHWTQRGLGPRAALPRAQRRARNICLRRSNWRCPMPTPGAPRSRRSASAPDRLMRVKQVHGNVVRILKRGEVPERRERRSGPTAMRSCRIEPGLALAVMVADCVPILLVDPVAAPPRRFTPAGAAPARALRDARSRSMQREFGTDPADLIAAIGPSAGPTTTKSASRWLTRFSTPATRRQTSIAGSSARGQAASRSVGRQSRSADRRRRRPGRRSTSAV